MNLELFTLSEGAYNHNGHLTIVSTIDFVNSESFPVTLPSLGIAVRLEFFPDESGKHTISIQNKDEKGNKSLDMNVELNVPDSEEKTIICMASNVNGIQFQQPGMYIFILSVDGKEYGECKLKLIQKE